MLREHAIRSLCEEVSSAELLAVEGMLITNHMRTKRPKASESSLSG